jgi:ComF family protein
LQVFVDFLSCYIVYLLTARYCNNTTHDLQHKYYNTMKLFYSILDLLAPDNCVGCVAEGSSLCVDCCAGLYWPDSCYSCRKLGAGSLTCDKCRANTKISALYFVAPYTDLAKKMIRRAKYRPSISTSRQMGSLLAAKLPYLDPSATVVTFVPTTGGRMRERGFDQAAECAKNIAMAKGLHFASLLLRTTKHHQVGSSRDDRIEHMKEAFKIKNPAKYKGFTVVLVDDVFTTGATIESAARELKKAGVGTVVGAVFARAV